MSGQDNMLNNMLDGASQFFSGVDYDKYYPYKGPSTDMNDVIEQLDNNNPFKEVLTELNKTKNAVHSKNK